MPPWEPVYAVAVRDGTPVGCLFTVVLAMRGCCCCCWQSSVDGEKLTLVPGVPSPSPFDAAAGKEKHDTAGLEGETRKQRGEWQDGESAT